MAVVYLAERADGEFDQQVALKVIERGRGAAELLRRERQILASLQHPHIARLLEGGTTPGGMIWFAMEPVRGTRIDRFVQEQQLGLDAILKLLLDVCDAVQFAHTRLLVHRDLKPSNILVSDDGDVKLLDFGIAMAEGSGIAPPALTPGYASPEQWTGAGVTTASDIWQLGTLVERLTAGRARGAALAAIVRRATELDPADRYPTVSELAADLARLRQRRPVLALPGTTHRLACLVARHRIATLSIIAVTVCAIATAAAFTHRLARERDAVAREADRANTALDFIVGMFRTGDPSVNRGAAIDVHEFLVRASERLRAEPPSSPELRAELLLAIGRIHLALGEPASARPILEDAEHAQQESDGVEPAKLAATLRDRGQAMLDLGDPQAALDVLQQSLALLEGDDRRMRCRRREVLDLLAMALVGVGRGDEAIATQREAVAIATEVHGVPSGELASSLQNLGIVLRRRAPGESIDAFARAFQMSHDLHGADHPVTAGAQQLYAVALMEANRLDEARPLLDDSVATLRRHYRGRGTRLAHAVRALGRMRARDDDHRAALELFREAEQLYVDSGEGHSVTLAWLWSSMAESYEALGDSASALRHHEHALAVRRERVPGQLVVAQSLEACSRDLARLGRTTEAATYDAEARALRSRMH